MPINTSTSKAIYRWKPACWMQVMGDDAANFLQGQFTNDLRLLDGSAAVYGLWLTLKGKVLADGFVLRGRRPKEFWVGSYYSPAAVIRERLESFVIADDVVIEDVTTQWEGLTLFDEPEPGLRTTLTESGGIVFPGRRDRRLNFELVYPVGEIQPAAIFASSAIEIEQEEVARKRILAGIPAIPVDLGPTDLPNEAGLEADAISYTKGCYLGQEVMARLKSMGQVRRRLWRVRGTGANWPALPAPVFALSRQVGELRSAVQDGAGTWAGLAMVSLMHTSPGAELSFAMGGSPEMRLNAEP